MPVQRIITRLPEDQMTAMLAAILLSRAPDPLITSGEVNEALDTAELIAQRSKERVRKRIREQRASKGE